MHVLKHKQQGFTLIEVLIVLGIVGILAGIIFVAVNNSRSKGQTAKVMADLSQIRTGLQLLEADTGKWPNGCPPSTSANPEVALDNPQSGILAVPTVGVVELPCEWTASEISYWNGPYVQATELTDPWGNSYVFDADYQPISPGTIVLLSYGPDETNYTSDDIYIYLKQ